MTRKENVWVTPHTGGWAVRRDHADTPERIKWRKANAESYARNLARQDQVELIVQRSDGTIQKKNSYGNDPFPPEDKQH